MSFACSKSKTAQASLFLSLMEDLNVQIAAKARNVSFDPVFFCQNKKRESDGAS